tara:strand:- start:428 stop:670 length:243 start_codon:yes stop_codon:yes gene_type:complete
MTPKEKAIELVDKFKNRSVELGQSHSQLLAEANALIAVDEILNNVMLYWYSPTKDMPKDLVYFVTQRKYWEDVKTEIEKL